MRHALCVSLTLVGMAATGLLSWGAWFFLLSGDRPPPRTDLIAIPEGTPAPPAGYPTENALKLAYVLGQVDIVDHSCPIIS